MRARQMIFCYGIALVLGLALFYAAGTGMVSGWLMPVGLFILIGWLFSLGFVVLRVLRGRWPKDETQ